MRTLLAAAILTAALVPANARVQRLEAFNISKIPARFVGEWCKVKHGNEYEDIHGTYRKARCPGSKGLRIAPTSYDFYTKARCTLQKIASEDLVVSASFLCKLSKHDREAEVGELSLFINDEGLLEVK
jgi:hypothetical protein